jgi:serine/threonine protein kinase
LRHLDLDNGMTYYLFATIPPSDQLWCISGGKSFRSTGITASSTLYVLDEYDSPDFFLSHSLPAWERDDRRYKFVRRVTATRGCSISLYRDTETGRECIGKQVFVDPRYRLYLMRELENLIAAKHSTSIKFLGFSRFSPHGALELLIFSEHYPNGSIADFCEKHAPSNTDKMIWIFGIAVGMAYLHSKRIQHRDLKPGNVFLDSRLRPLIGDLGSSKDVSLMDSMQQSNAVGTPRYTAPELLSDGSGSWEADVFSYAMTVYEIVTGEAPFAGTKTPGAVMQKIMAGQRPPLPGTVPDALRSLITRCWSQNPRDRPKFAAIVDFLIHSGPLLPGVDPRAYQHYVGELSSQTLTFEGR